MLSNVTSKPDDWQTVRFEGTTVEFRYPVVTPQGQTAERVDERAKDHRGDIERVHVSSPDGHELYVEVARFRDLSPQDEYEGHRPYLQQRFGPDSVTPLTETTFGERPAWAFEIRADEHDRSVLLFQLDEDTFRVIWNPRSDLNSEVVATLSFD
jgi:hypothetical protein